MRARPINALLNVLAFSLLFFALYLNFLKKDDPSFLSERSFAASAKEPKAPINMPADNAATAKKTTDNKAL
jgi:hypothetical protein